MSHAVVTVFAQVPEEDQKDDGRKDVLHCSGQGLGIRL